MRPRGWLVVALLAVAALLLAGRALTLLVVEHQWFSAMGQEQLWWERTAATFLLQGGLALCGSLFAFANFTAVRSTILAVAVPQRVGNLELTAMIPGQRLVWITAVFALLVGVALAVPFDDWTILSMARHGVPFGEIEGYHDRDLGFYVYWLPFEETLYLWSLVAIVVMTALVTLLYALTRSLRMDGRRIIASSHVRRHMSCLGALVLLLLAWSYRLDSFDLLRQGSGADGLFLHVDHKVTLRVDVGLAVLAAVASLLFLRAGWLGQIRAAMAIIGVVLVAAVGLRHGLPALLERGNTLGEPARRDADYLATRALVSRRAYDADAVRMVGMDTTLRVDTRVPMASLGSRISLWDAMLIERASTELSDATARNNAPVLPSPAIVRTEHQTTGMLQVRPGNSGESWHVYLRDLSSNAPTSQELAWRATTDTLDEGQHLLVAEPLVAPGLRGHTVVRDPTESIPGARLESFVSRLSHAWSARDPGLLSQDSSVQGGVFVPFRDVRERVAALAPVFAQGSEVQPLLHDRTLYWTVELYSASLDYPLSQQWMLAGAPRSYFRHAGTALVDAVTGRVRIVRVALPDPVARTWIALTPSLWVSVDDLPVDLANALPPATDGAIAQLRTFARYGSRFEGQVPRYFPDSALAHGRLSPMLVRVDTTLTPAWSAPVLDDGDQLGGIATAVGGRMRATFWDTTSVPRQAWTTAVEQLRSGLDSARATVPQGSRREPRVRFGRVHAVMTTTGPILAQAVHLSTGDGALPIVRVGVRHADRVVTARDLFDASSRLTGETVVPPQPSTVTAFPDTRDATTMRLYDSMREALKRADWVRFGAAFDSLGRALGRPPQ